MRVKAVILCLLFTQGPGMWRLLPGQDAKWVIPGPEYKKSFIHTFLFGQHHRKTWLTAVNVPVLAVRDSGWVPTKEGGGRESRNLRFDDAQGRCWVARSVNKDLSNALLNKFQRRLFTRLARDHVSANHPYAPMVVSTLAEAIDIPHATPLLYVLPDDSSLGSFHKNYADMLVLVEERPDESWNKSEIFKRSKDIRGSENVMKERFEHGNICFDTQTYLKCRMLDLLIGDWSRHIDQYRWIAVSDAGCKVKFIPVPRDRDHSFYRNDGAINRVSMLLAPKMQTFGPKLKNIKALTFTGKEIDRIVLSQSGLDEFLQAARHVQHMITDQVIEEALARLPQPVKPIVYEDWQNWLKSRRAQLEEAAREYYRLMQSEVFVLGSDAKESFVVTAVDNGVRVTVSNDNAPYFSRIFQNDNTRKIYLVGLGAEDSFRVNLGSGHAVKVYLLPGPGTDHVEVTPRNRSVQVVESEDENDPGYTDLIIRPMLRK